MNRPSRAAVAVGTVGGVANALVVYALMARAAYPTIDSPAGIVGVVAPAFVLGFAPLAATAYTRLLAPAGGFVAMLAGVVRAEFRSPQPEWGQLGGYTVVDGPLHVSNYVTAAPTLLSLLLVAAVAEFGLRRGYGPGDRWLRNLPTLPSSRRRVGLLAAVTGAILGFATLTLVWTQSGVGPIASLPLFVGTAAVTAVPLAALLSRGIVLPLALYALVVPRFLLVEVFGSTDSYVHILVFVPYAIVLAVAWALEAWLRSVIGGRGGRFAQRRDGS